MNYREKFDAYKKGILSEKDTIEIENDIEKFNVLMEYFDEKLVTAPVAVLTSSDEDFTFSEQIDKLINKRIKKSTISILLISAAFVVFFLIGCGGTEILESAGLPQGLAHFLFGLFSAAYYIVNFRLLYTAFIKKQIKSAVFIIVWNIVLIVLTFVFSIFMGDAVAFAMPIVSGFTTLPQYFADIFDSVGFDNVMHISGLAMIPLSIILALTAVIFSKKSISFRPVSKKLAKKLIAVFLVSAIAISGASTAISYYRGFFRNDHLGSKLTEDEIYELDDVFIKSDPFEKTDDELKDILENLGYSYFSESDGYYRKGRSDNMTASFYFGENSSDNSRCLSISFAYECINPYINQEKMKKISEGKYFSYGDEQSDVMSQLCRYGLYPDMLQYTRTDEEQVTVCRVVVSVKKNDGYPDGYRDIMEFEFNNGILTRFDGRFVEE